MVPYVLMNEKEWNIIKLFWKVLLNSAWNIHTARMYRVSFFFQPEWEKIRTRKISDLGTFHIVLISSCGFQDFYFISRHFYTKKNCGGFESINISFYNSKMWLLLFLKWWNTCFIINPSIHNIKKWLNKL